MTMHELIHHTEIVLHWYEMISVAGSGVVAVVWWVCPGAGRHRRPRG